MMIAPTHAVLLHHVEKRIPHEEIFNREEGPRGSHLQTGKGALFEIRGATRACHKARVVLQYSHGKKKVKQL
jgi:hypothetical protein